MPKKINLQNIKRRFGFVVLFIISLTLSAMVRAKTVEVNCTTSGDASGLYIGPFHQYEGYNGTDCYGDEEGGFGSVTCKANTSKCGGARIDFSYKWKLQQYMTDDYDICDVYASIDGSSFSERINDRYQETNNATDCSDMYEGLDSKNLSGTGDEAEVKINFDTIDNIYGSSVGCGFTTMPVVECIPDLSIEYVKPIQVIEGANADNDNKIDLVANKPVMVRVKVNLIYPEGIDAEVELKIFEEENSQPVWSSSKTETIKPNYSEKDKKLGENTVNFFPTKEDGWEPSNKNYIFNATVDPNDNIEESNEDNNNGGPVNTESRVQEDEDYMVSWLPLEMGLWTELFGSVAGFDRAYNRNKDFLNSVYPLAKVTHYKASKIDPPDWLPPPNCILIGYLSTIPTLFGGVSDRIVGVVSQDESLGGVKGASCHGYAVLISAEGQDYAVAAHEIGHTYGLDDEYQNMGDADPYNDYYGEFADKGWCLNLKTGNSCEKKLSEVPKEPGPPRVRGARINVKAPFSPTYSHRSVRESIRTASGYKHYPVFYNFMGASGPAAWAHKQAYKELMEKLTK